MDCKNNEEMGPPPLPAHAVCRLARIAARLWSESASLVTSADGGGGGGRRFLSAAAHKFIAAVRSSVRSSVAVDTLSNAAARPSRRILVRGRTETVRQALESSERARDDGTGVGDGGTSSREPGTGMRRREKTHLAYAVHFLRRKRGHVGPPVSDSQIYGRLL